MIYKNKDQFFILHFQPCHVVYTDYRPVPLQHFIFPSGGDGIHLVVDEFGKFREDNFSEAIGKLAGGEGGGQKSFKKAGQKDGSDCYNIVKMIMERNFAPVIVFSFSKKECEAYALQMSKLDFNTPEEKKLVGEVFQNAMMVLSEEDRALPQVENVLPLLKRGIVALCPEGAENITLGSQVSDLYFQNRNDLRNLKMGSKQSISDPTE